MAAQASKELKRLSAAKHDVAYAQQAGRRAVTRFDVLLQGTAIEATFWREVADKVYDALEEGKVCLI